MNTLLRSNSLEDESPHYFIQFHPIKWNFKLWIQIMNITLLRLKINSNRKNYILLKMISYSVFTNICKIINPVDPLDLTFDMIVSILDQKYSF